MIGALGAIMAVGTGFKILGALQQAQVTRRQSEFFSARAKENADLALMLGASDEAIMSRQQAFRRGKIVGGYAGKGIDVTTGSPLMVVAEQARLDAYARSRRGYDAQLRARDLMISKASSDYRGSVALVNGITSAFGEGLAGVGNLAMAGGGGGGGAVSTDWSQSSLMSSGLVPTFDLWNR